MQLDLSTLLKLFLLIYMRKRKISHIWVAYVYDRGTVICLNLLNLYFPQVTILYTLKTSENLTRFLVFLGIRKRVHWGQLA